ncbi:cytochrome P450 [Aspergillus ruber CBS 135680]|uniref:Cytochrome P450 n=1 Tax=Aspergillus ruber (strain CBS 135680) TaxID=1388766 RepID=A0A017S861_ASPRC|nr:cytochrome P450 [Aspergillus ruber CBS 135680]EYE92370.1 cytochrome P450 [Aspergillus ruber CBS 135680]
MLSVLIVTLIALCSWYFLRPKRRLPPGPSFISGLIAGNNDFKSFQKWNQQYGPIVSAKIGTRTYIILGTRQAAQDLLEKRGNIYSDRPPSVLLDNYLSKRMGAAFMPYGPEWRLNRRLHGSLLSSRAADSYRYLQDIQSRILLHGFLESNELEKFHQYTSDVMFTLVYGKGQGRNDDDHRRLEHINEMVAFVLQGASFGTAILELFPVLDRLPHFFMKWRKKAEQLHEKTTGVYTECCNTALGVDCWNWCHEAMQKQDVVNELPWENLCYALGDLYVAGVHTSKMVMEIFVLASILHPDAVKKAHEELDSVIGSERLPTFEDMDHLPYINAFILELLRWKPISPIAVPHAVTQNDEYMGYSIPKGATVIANQYTINMDESVFENPTAFKPERHIGNPDPPVSAFGFGRRRCPGEKTARSTLFIVISRMLWGYDITSAEAAERPTEESNAGSVKADFHVRSDEHQRVIEREFESADKDEKRVLRSMRESMQAKI